MAEAVTRTNIGEFRLNHGQRRFSLKSRNTRKGQTANGTLFNRLSFSFANNRSSVMCMHLFVVRREYVCLFSCLGGLMRIYVEWVASWHQQGAVWLGVPATGNGMGDLQW